MIPTINLREEDRRAPVCLYCCYSDDLVETEEGYLCHEKCYEMAEGVPPVLVNRWESEEWDD